MPWCHNCKSEYRDGFDTCADCGAPLLPDPPEDATPKPEGDPVYREMALLASCVDPMQAVHLKSFLDAEDIPSFQRANGVMKHNSAVAAAGVPVDLFVPAERLEQAQRVMADLQTIREGQDGEPPAEPIGEQNGGEAVWRELVLLRDGLDELEAVRVITYLEAEGIACARRPRGRQQNILTGYWQQGAMDLMVAPADLERARDLLTALESEPDQAADGFADGDDAQSTQWEPDEELARMAARRRRMMILAAWILVILFVLLVRFNF